LVLQLRAADHGIGCVLKRTSRPRAGEARITSLVMLGVAERLAISLLLSGAAFLGVAWALA
jgi:hypothetical protein